MSRFAPAALLGWTPEALARIAELRGWTEQAIERLELEWNDGNGRPVGIPVRDATADRVGTLRYDPTGRADPKMRAEAGGTRELFPPPEMIGDDELVGGLLLLTEGEPDTVAAWSHGFAAVGVPGVQGWKPEYAARFSGRRWTVCVSYDCDDGGRKKAPEAAASLFAAGVDVRLVDLDPTHPRDDDDHYDLSDFLRERGAGALRELLEQTPAYALDREQPVSPIGETDRPWQVQAWPEFRDTSPQSHRWLIEGLLPEGALVFIAGPPKKGKTWLGIALALAVATGTPLFGEYLVPEARNVLYVALEGSRVGLRARIGALTRGLGLDPDGDDLKRLHMLYRPRPFDLVDGSSGDELFTTASDLDAALVIIDVLRAAARFKENEQAEFSRVRDAIEPMLTASRTVPVLHHFGKLSDTQQQRSPGERMAGTGAMYGALDVGFMITRSESGARRVRVEIEARDFAAPDALGVVITGSGSGEHGGFTYTDEARLILDESAAEGRDLVAEIDAHLVAFLGRTVPEIASEKKDGIGANPDEVRATLNANPDRFVRVDPARVERHPTAKPWVTTAQLRDLEDAEKVTRAPESPESAQATWEDELLVEQVAPLTGSTIESPAPPQRAGGSESPGRPSHPTGEGETDADVPDATPAEIEEAKRRLTERDGWTQHDPSQVNAEVRRMRDEEGT